MPDGAKLPLILGWQLASLGTFIYLLFFDGYTYTSWNWVVAVPVDAFLAEIWPIYWAILRPMFS